MSTENERKTIPPVEIIDNKMVALSLSSMATTLEAIQQAVKSLPTLAAEIRTIDNQHIVTLGKLEELRGTVNLAGGMAARALQETTEARAGLIRVENTLDRIERSLGKLALSVQGLEQASRSLMDSVYPERDSPSTPPTIELADVVPLHSRRVIMTGE